MSCADSVLIATDAGKEERVVLVVSPLFYLVFFPPYFFHFPFFGNKKMSV